MVVNRDGENTFAVSLPHHVLIELRDDLFRRRNPREQRLGRSPAALLLLQNRLAQVDALAADIDVARPFDQRADIAVTLATE